MINIGLVVVTLVFTSFEVVFTLGKKDGKWYEVGTGLGSVGVFGMLGSWGMMDAR